MSNELLRRPPGYDELSTFLNQPKVLLEMGKASRSVSVGMEGMVRQVLTLIMRDPKGRSPLLNCHHSTIALGIMDAASLGLEISGPLGQCFLVARKDRAVFQLGYKGLIALAFRSGHVSSFAMRTVYEGDHFTVQYGTDAQIEHKPGDMATKRPATHYYAVVKFANGGHDFEVMSLEQCQEHRNRFAASKSEYAPWQTNFDQMAMKTCAVRLSKRLPLCPDLQRGAHIDEYGEAEVDVQREYKFSLADKSRSQQAVDLLAGPPMAPGEADLEDAKGDTE